MQHRIGLEPRMTPHMGFKIKRSSPAAQTAMQTARTHAHVAPQSFQNLPTHA
jgi:hypothetical protein